MAWWQDLAGYAAGSLIGGLIGYLVGFVIYRKYGHHP